MSADVQIDADPRLQIRNPHTSAGKRAAAAKAAWQKSAASSAVTSQMQREFRAYSSNVCQSGRSGLCVCNDDDRRGRGSAGVTWRCVYRCGWSGALSDAEAEAQPLLTGVDA